MNYAQLVTDVQAQTAAIEEKHVQADDLRRQLAWYDEFDPAAAVIAAQDAVTVAARELVMLNVDRVAAEAVTRRVPKPRFAPNFVTVATLFVYDTGRLWQKARSELKAIKARQAELEPLHAQALDVLTQARAEADDHAAFDPAAAAARLAELDDEIAAMTPERDRLAGRIAANDEEAAPYEEDLRRVREDLADMGRRRNARYDKLRSDEDRIEKRIRQIRRKAVMDVRKVVIDGSNLVYGRGNGKVGLFALRPLCAKLLESMSVQVVFDHTIIGSQGVRTEADIEARMPGIQPHIAESETEADDLIFRLADGDPTVYILSNDRYPDYKARPAHKDDRVLKVEIVEASQVIIVPMLDINVPYTRTR